MTYDVQLVELPSEVTAVMRAHVPAAEISAFLGTAFGTVERVLGEQGLVPAGPPFGRFVPSGDGFDVEAGFPASDEVAPSGGVVPGELPGGPAAEVLHTGGYAEVAGAYQAAGAWLAEHGYEPAGDGWESYLDEPGVARPRTIVRVPCRRVGAGARLPG